MLCALAAAVEQNLANDGKNIDRNGKTAPFCNISHPITLPNRLICEVVEISASDPYENAVRHGTAGLDQLATVCIYIHRR